MIGDHGINGQGLGGCCVLVVDDDVGFQQLVIGTLLEMMGITDITYAEDGLAGLEAARRRRPDLIVLDISMPRMDGFEMLRHLRGDAALADIPVIIQSGQDSCDNRDQMFAAGASDFVSKPINGSEFQGRLRVHLQNVLLVRQLQEQLRRVADELGDAAAVQRQHLPSPAVIAGLKADYGLLVDHCFEPSSELGGDFWGAVPINSHAAAIYICDFAGHGVSAALNTIRLHTLVRQLPPPAPDDPAAFVRDLNRLLCEHMTNCHYATFLMAVVDVAAHTLTWCGAASPDPLLGSAGGDVGALDGSGIPLGIMPAAPYENRVVAFPRGASLFLYSDAMSESRAAQGAILGTAGMTRLVTAALDQVPPGGGRLGRILADFAGSISSRAKDDLTAVWIER